MKSDTRFWDELAVLSYKALLKKKPHDAFIHMSLALAYARLGRENKTIRFLLRAVKYDKNYAEAYYHLGVFYKRAGKDAEALRSFKKYRKILQQDGLEGDVVAEMVDKIKRETEKREASMHSYKETDTL
jgi:predicted Zn-dependent protease